MQGSHLQSIGGRPDLAGRKVFALQIRRWKQSILDAFFPEADFTYLPLYISDAAFFRNWARAIKAGEKPVLLTWGAHASPAITAFAQDNGIPLCFLEDGFIRSLVPNASQSMPFSLTLDWKAPYFDCRSPSDLEILLGSYDFELDPELMQRARNGIARLLSSRLSKYNTAVKSMPSEALRKGTKPRVLVIGQVEDDASIRVGCDRDLNNNDVVRLAAEENPDCDIIYRPHPDVLNGVRERLSNPAEVAHICQVFTGRMPLPDLLATVDHVYTITSLGGFEALLRGIPVTLLGCPFYGGWGLTDDRQLNSRRTRKLSIEEVFAAAYLLYPLYFNPVTGEKINFETCLDLAERWRRDGVPESLVVQVTTPPKPGFEIFGPYGLFGWRHLMTERIAGLVARDGSPADVEEFRRNPILFFRELSDARLRKWGRIFYPFD